MKIYTKIHSIIEEFLFLIIEHISIDNLPLFITDWIVKYLNTRKSELQNAIIKNRWHEIELNKITAD